MEVFAAVYDKSLIEIIRPCAMIVNANSFASMLTSHKIVFCGNGRQKLQNVLCHANAIFSSVSATAADLSYLAYQSFIEKKFASLSYAEPFYIKEFHSSAS
jgi:tRNA threonylcarbamoyladenosine biosynthesis protein TsaB